MNLWQTYMALGGAWLAIQVELRSMNLWYTHDNLFYALVMEKPDITSEITNRCNVMMLLYLERLYVWKRKVVECFKEFNIHVDINHLLTDNKPVNHLPLAAWQHHLVLSMIILL